MALIEGEPSSVRVSVSSLSHEVRNGGNNSCNRIQLIVYIQHSEEVDKEAVTALEIGWRKAGEVVDSQLDTEIMKNPH